MATVLDSDSSKKNEPKDWTGYWDTGNTPWHKTEVNPLLTKYIHLLETDKKKLKFFFPLCGKSIDMKWLMDRGHSIVGVEISSLAIESFFTENSLEYSVETQNEISKYSEKSGRITLYCCNIYDFLKTGEKSFDAVWDRGGFGAINPDDRPRYVELMLALKSPDCRHFVEVYEYDVSIRNNYPYSLPMSTIVELLGENWNIELLESQDALDTGKKFSDQFKSFTRNFFLVTHK